MNKERRNQTQNQKKKIKVEETKFLHFFQEKKNLHLDFGTMYLLYINLEKFRCENVQKEENYDLLVTTLEKIKQT